MEILILKNNEIFARSTDNEYSVDDLYRIELLSELPEYPGEPSKGKYWKLVWNDGNVQWIEASRPLTTEERVTELEAGLSELLGGAE